jgi:hypothetical protein
MAAHLGRRPARDSCAFRRRRSVAVRRLSLRQFARYLADHEPDIDTIAAIDRDVAEDYTVWLAARLGHAARCR